MVDSIEPIEEISRAKPARNLYEEVQLHLEIPSAWTGSLVTPSQQIKILTILLNPEHDLNEATLENKKIEIQEQTNRAKEEERRLHHRILEEGLLPKNLYTQTTSKFKFSVMRKLS